MSSFDFIDAVGRAYLYVWEKRRLLLRLAIIPFLAKALTLIVIYLSGLEENYIRQGLMLIPADFLEALFVIFMLRLALYDEVPLPSTVTASHDDPVMKERKRAILAGALLYLLIKVLASLNMATLLMRMEAEETAIITSQAAQDYEVPAFLLTLVLFAFFIWAFRLLWLHVPAAMGIRLTRFLTMVRGYAFSFILIATWLLSFIPVMVLVILVFNLAYAIMPDPEDITGLTPLRLVLLLTQTGAELFSTLVATLAVGFGIQMMVDEKQ